MPENMNLPPIPNAVILQDDSLIRLWHKRDDSFFVPKTNVWFMIRTPSAYVSPASCIKGKMLTELLKDDLNELSYYADCAGLSYDFDNNTEGFVVS